MHSICSCLKHAPSFSLPLKKCTEEKLVEQDVYVDKGHDRVSYEPRENFEAHTLFKVFPTRLWRSPVGGMRSMAPASVGWPARTMTWVRERAGAGNKCRGVSHGSCEKHLGLLRAAKAKSPPDLLSQRVWPCGQDSRTVSRSPAHPSVQMQSRTSELQ